MKKFSRNAGVLVIGGGIAGATAAERLSRAGMEIHLVEKQTDIGGHVREMGCKATDVCMRCNVCVADEILRTVRQSSDIHIHTSTELLELRSGENGNRYTAILGNGSSKLQPVDTDFVIIATGYEPYNPIENSSYGYGHIPNVITGVDAERQLFLDNRIVRPSDGQRPKRIAFVQCVGSRTEELYRRPEDTDYCSTVCCSYALRIARLMKHQAEESEITIFYMDIQKFGKGFNKFYSDCKDKMRFIRSRPYQLKPGTGGTVLVRYAPEAGESSEFRVQSSGFKVQGGKWERTEKSQIKNQKSKMVSVCEEEFDMVILSVGIRPRPDAWNLADKLGVPVDEHGFFGLKTASSMPDLQKEGIFVAGANESPKDIAGSIAQAEAVSANILRCQRSEIRGQRRKSRTKGISRDVVVIGGGIAGMQTAVALAKLGHKVSLLHNSQELGGVTAAMPELYAYLGSDVNSSEEATRSFVTGLANEIEKQKNIKVYPNTSLKSVKGDQGNFFVAVTCNGKTENFRAGAVVLATGSTCRPVAGSWDSPRVVDLRGLLDLIRKGNPGKRVAIIVDLAGEQGRALWAHVLSAAEILSRRRSAEVKVYCSNVRVAATGLEDLYRRAREAGVIIAKLWEKPLVSEKGFKIVVTFNDPITGAETSEEFDLAVMADLQPHTADVAGAVQQLRIGPDGELQYDNVWLLPGLSNRPGIFVVGEARGNSEYREALTDAAAVANEIHDLLTGDQIKAHDDVATVDADKCVLCLTCLRVCPHGAITVDNDKKAAYPSPISCKRCGTCVSECPAQAISLPGFTDEDIAGEIGRKPQVVVFACENSAIPAAEAAGHKYPKSVKFIKVPCAGQVDCRSILAALESGASKVMILGCHPESCRYLSGSSRAVKRTERLAGMLNKAGFDGSRVAFGGIASIEPGKFVEYVKGRG